MNADESHMKAAYDDVSFKADKTWTDTPTTYHDCNLGLYLFTKHIDTSQKQSDERRPRTVRECIPNSRLARYNNYSYNEPREMSYNLTTTPSGVFLAPDLPTGEFWDTAEMVELYRWFSKNPPEDNFCRVDMTYESPLLHVSGFHDKLLKLQICEDRIKNIWRSRHYVSHRTQTPFLPRKRSNELDISVYLTPLQQYFVLRQNRRDFYYNRDCFPNVSITTDLEQIQHLKNTMLGHSMDISKHIMETATVSTEMSYSEVVQGISSRRTVNHHHQEVQKNGNFVPTPNGATDCHENVWSDYNCAFSNNQRPECPAVFAYRTEDHHPHPSTHQNYPRYNPMSSQYQLYLEALARNRLLYTYWPQAYYYYPLAQLQRCYQSQLVAYQMQHQYDLSRFFPTTSNTSTASSDRSEEFNVNTSHSYSDDSFNPFKHDPQEHVRFLMEAQVCASPSEELEIQALEQYTSSNENVYRQLEQQAEEQYEDSPDE